MAVLTAAELNFIIFRYLQESGFLHTAFNFGFEAGVNNSPIDGSLVPPAALIKVMQKGLQFIEMEANADNDTDEEFSFLQTMDLITKDVDELKKIVKDKKKKQAAGGKELSEENEEASCQTKDKAREDQGKLDTGTLGKIKTGKRSKRRRKRQTRQSMGKLHFWLH